MSTSRTLVLRLFLVPAGWLCALLAALAVLVVVLAGQATPASPADHAILTLSLALFTAAAVWVIGPVALIASLAAIVLAEAFRIRSWLYFAAAGALIAAIVWQVSETPEPGPPFFSALEIAAAGLAGGLIYWLIAGRSSGLSPRA